MPRFAPGTGKSLITWGPVGEPETPTPESYIQACAYSYSQDFKFDSAERRLYQRVGYLFDHTGDIEAKERCLVLGLEAIARQEGSRDRRLTDRELAQHREAVQRGQDQTRKARRPGLGAISYIIGKLMHHRLLTLFQIFCFGVFCYLLAAY